MRITAFVWVVLLLALPAMAADPASTSWRKRHKIIDRAEKAFDESFQERVGPVYSEWLRLIRLWRSDPDANRGEVLPLDGLRELYEAFAELQADRVAVDLDLAESGWPGAASTLQKEALDLQKEIDKLEKGLADAKATVFYVNYDQAPGVRRHGLALRQAGLIAALAKAEDAVAFLSGDGWKSAAKADRSKAWARRVLVVDALGATRDPAALPALERAATASEPALRIAAAEALVPFGAAAVATVTALLDDPAPAVQRAAVESIRDLGADQPLWIGPLVAVMPATRRLSRWRVIEALVALTGERLGDDPGMWALWYESRREAIEGGTWARPEPEEPADGEEAPPPPPPLVPPAAATFYGVPCPSDRVAFVADGGDSMGLPAELEIQTSRSDRHWLGSGTAWRKDMLDHRGLLLEQLDVTQQALSEGARFAVVHLSGSIPARVGILGDKRRLKPSKGTRKSVAKLIDKPTPDGSLSIETGLRRVFAIDGNDPLATPKDLEDVLDAVYVVAPGWNGGIYGIPEAVVAEVRRVNRFHRLQVNTIRITDEKVESEALLKGLAEATGGTYLWLEELP